MMSNVVRAAALVLTVVASSQSPAHAQDLSWEVMNPFRFYKDGSAFKMHEDAFKVVAGNQSTADKGQLIRNIERCLNDPGTADPAIRTACAAILKERIADPRLGWAASTLDSTCYDHEKARPRAYPAKCERERSGGRVLEDYVLPDSHAVSITLAPARRAEAGIAQCTWSWRPRAGGNWQVSGLQPCTERKVIERVPYATNRAISGLDVKVDVAGGRSFTEQVVVEDLLITALGDSFASGEGNPDKPVTFSATRGMSYKVPRCEVATATLSASGKNALRFRAGLAEANNFVLPRRFMKDERGGQGIQFDNCSPEFEPAFWEASARWLSGDCHRSQYAFPVRVSLQLALEDRHRAVTLIQLACSGALANNGLFGTQEARPHYDPLLRKIGASLLKASAPVPAQFDQLTKLLCSVEGRTNATSYAMKIFVKSGDPELVDASYPMRWCPPDKRKRDIDLVLLSIGGNDVGFSALAAYSFLERMADIAPVAFILEKTDRFGPNVSEAYLSTLDGRIEAVRKALKAGFGVESSTVIQASYENAEYDEGGKFCGEDSSRDTVGMDVHNRFKFNVGRVREVNRFFGKLFARLQCVTNAEAGCPTNLKTGDGTKFTLVTDHQPEFLSRGICARGPDPQTREEDTRMPRIPLGQAGAFAPYAPSLYRPYAHRTRLFRTPNDAFLTANEHREREMVILDPVQPAVAALLSGAFHPTAEAHAIVADHVMAHARRVLSERQAAR